MALHFEFHRLVVASTGNPVVMLLAEIVEGVCEGAGWSYLQRRDREDADRNRRKALRAHTRLVTLIEEGDVEGATALWHRHIVDVSEFLTDGDGDRAAVLDVLDPA